MTETPTARTRALALFTLLATTACGTVHQPHAAREVTGATRWTTSLCEDVEGPVRGDRLVLQRSDSHWKVAPESTNVERASGRERVRIDARRGQVCLDAPRPPEHAYGDRCWLRLFGGTSHGDRAEAGYLACNSDFVKCRGSKLDATVLIPAVGAVTMQRLCDPFVRHDELWKALDDSGALVVARSRHHATYRRAFEEASDVASYRAFLAAYRDDDPDQLVPRAEQSLAALEAKERADALARYRAAFEQASSKQALSSFVEQYRTDDPEQLVPKAKEAIARLDALEAQQDEERLRSFRAGLGVGDETQCGLVVELKPDGKRRLVQVQHATGAHWLPIEEVFPTGTARCTIAEARPAGIPRDAQGRPILEGPIRGDRDLDGVHIVSRSVGVVHEGPRPIRITNSVIEAQICVQTPGHVGLTLMDNVLDCALGVRFLNTDLLMDNVFMDNAVRGAMSNAD